MLGKKDHKTYLLEKIILLFYKLMDYWLPFIVILTFPLWIIPFLIGYFLWKSHILCRYFFKMSNTLLDNYTLPQLQYAILKGNGRYLREQCEHVLKYQFYDYTSRRFMSVGQLESDSKIIELECDDDIGIRFLSESYKSGIIVGVQSNPALVKQSNNCLGIIVPTDYSISGERVGYDCMLIFNFKSKMAYQPKDCKVDLVKILTYCKYHMNANSSYLIYGDYFQEGQIRTFQDLFRAFNLKIVDEQDITKNIKYAKKITNDRNKYCEQKVFDVVVDKIKNMFGKKNYEDGKKFIVLILENN